MTADLVTDPQNLREIGCTDLWADELDVIATYDRRASLETITVPTRIVAAALDRILDPITR
jgi:pimeloyl-ACP methyl ester carboxylesterase